jgi:hypothetical protein
MVRVRGKVKAMACVTIRLWPGLGLR